MINGDKNITILLVDDRLGQRQTFVNMLRRLGYTSFLEADSGETALDVLQASPIDLIISDWNMPGMNGLELLRRIREEDNLKDLPFLMVSGEVDEATVAQAAEGEVDGYILKPFNPLALQEKITEILERKSTPSPIDVCLELAAVYIKSRQWDKAEAEFKKALIINPDSPRTYHAMGLMTERQGDLLGAKHYYQQAISLSPRFLKAHEALAKVCQQLGDKKTALRHLDAAAKISPRNTDRQLQLGQAFLEAGLKDKAKEVFGRAMELAQENYAGTAAKIGESLLAADLVEEAQQAFQHGLAANPTDLHLYNRLGIAFRRQGKSEEAIANYLKALEIDPENESLHYNLGRAHLEAGHREEALAAMSQALKIFPDFKEAREFLAKYGPS